MSELFTFWEGLTRDQLLGLVAVFLAAVAAIYTAIPVHMARRTGRQEAARQRPGVQATINGSPSIDGWRSVQIHIKAPEGQKDFEHKRSGWRIMSVTLVSPRNAKLAFARADDHSLKGPIVGPSERVMSGRMGDIQPFAMEFFMRFPETPTSDHGKRAKFRIKIWKKQPYDPGSTLDAWATVPADAATQRELAQ